VRRTPMIDFRVLAAAVALAVLPLAGYAPTHVSAQIVAAAAPTVGVAYPVTTPSAPVSTGTTPATTPPGGASPAASGTATATAITGTIAVGTPVTTTLVVTGTPPATGTATVTARATPSPRVTAATRTATAATRTATAATRTATPRPTATARSVVTPRATPNPHPGFGDAPWAPGEYYVWTIAGRDIVSGTAYQLFTRSGHQWIDSSAYTLVEQRRYALLPSVTTFTGRTAFDTNTYKLRRYDAVGALRSDDPDTTPVGSVLRATLFGPHLDYTSYQTWSRPGHAGCTIAKGRRAPETTTAYGMMADLLRTITPRATGPATYTVFDPYSREPAAPASYLVLGHDTLSTILGKVATVHVRFREGSQAPLDIWYATTPGHVVVKWGVPGRFGATLARYEKSSARVALPVSPPTVALPTGSAACA